jgi:hypothetical protein
MICVQCGRSFWRVDNVALGNDEGVIKRFSYKDLKRLGLDVLCGKCVLKFLIEFLREGIDKTYRSH